MRNNSNAAAAAPPDYVRDLANERRDLARKITRKIADFIGDRISAETFALQTGSIAAGFFSRLESNFKEEHLRETFPNAYPFEDFRVGFQDRVEELMAEREANKAPDENFKNSLIKITEKFLEGLTGIRV